MSQRTLGFHFVKRSALKALGPAFAIVALLFSADCTSGDSLLADVDPDAVPDSTTYDQVHSIIQRECSPCHNEGGTVPRFDTCEHILENYAGLYEQVIEKNAMPPGAWPRLSSEQQLVLLRWNGEAPCAQ
jgi:uncharacterized membrane protein